MIDTDHTHADDCLCLGDHCIFDNRYLGEDPFDEADYDEEED